MEPFGGSGEEIEDESARQVIRNIVECKIIPDYMKRERITIFTKIEKQKQLLILLRAYLSGEHYNTPHPLITKTFG